ncbi:MAG: transglycosylase domain-containing protein [Lewinellaceae bacterium]|nr:transglycosylase domain-containing protein [Saprospiraceae bacterium]MCB9336925.1 transglycosylase domain-containing protein [Lewinellaceae bacterium]
MSRLTPQQMRNERMVLYQYIVRWMWRLLLFGILATILTFFLLSFSDLPDTEELENPKSEEASQVFAADGNVLGRYFIENRVPVDFDELSPYIEQALVSTEDERYYSHSGIDFRALGRVFFKTILMADRSSGGASTITQQLAKLLFTGPKGSGLTRVVQKLKEWIIAVQLERKYTKEEIIAMYLNKFDFLYDSYGIKAASETYFAKSQDSLNVQEAAMLVGMLNNPSLFNPKRKMALAEQRRSIVLNQMRKNGILTETAYDSLKVLPIDISNFKRKTHTQGLAQYFRSELAKELMYRILPSDDARKKSDGTPFNIYKDGLRIYTTIDPVMQQYAEEAVAEHMAAVQQRFWNLWNKRMKISPWDYKNNDTTPEELAYRKRKINQMVRSSERYATMRDQFMGTVENDLENEVEGLRLSDANISWMIKEEFPKDIDASERARYRRAMQKEQWNKVKKQWLAFQKEVEKVFNEPVQMKVFDYNDTMEKDTVMTPLDSLKYHHLIMQIGSLAIDPKTGYVKAWIGGVNHKYFALDHTRTNRQVGSTFKPFIYATAIAQQGISPCFEVLDVPRTIFAGSDNFHLIKDWTPQNSTGRYSYQSMQLRSALKKSVNSVSVFLMQQLGSVQPVIDLLGNMGVDTKKIPEQPSICLGAADMTVMDMTGAYTTFANNGYYSRPIYITRIEDKNGRTIYVQEDQERQALQEEPNYVMVEMLKYASGGMGLKSEVGGKTGTTNDYVDGWFMGITPSLVVGTWVGGEDRWVRFLSLAEGQGSRMAKPFCKAFLKKVENDPKADYQANARFVKPGGDLSIGLDCSQYNQRDTDDDEASDPGNDTDTDNDAFFEDPFGTNKNIKQDTSVKKKIVRGDEGFNGG